MFNEWHPVLMIWNIRRYYSGTNWKKNCLFLCFFLTFPPLDDIHSCAQSSVYAVCALVCLESVFGSWGLRRERVPQLAGRCSPQPLGCHGLLCKHTAGNDWTHTNTHWNNSNITQCATPMQAVLESLCNASNQKVAIKLMVAD